MAWFQIDDRLWAHPKFLGLPDRALALWVKAGAWCASHLTDGFVPDKVLPLLGAKQPAVNDLLRHGLWLKVDGGYQFHDWLDWQRSREQVEADREKARSRQRKSRRNTTTGRYASPFVTGDVTA